MRGFIANTDHGWYEFLRAQGPLEEVNFWQPGTRTFKAVQPGEPLFFRLKAPHKAIGGFGIFLRWTRLPIWLAWDAFGQRNGVASRREMIERVARLRHGSDPAGTASIGCIVLLAPVFFEPDAWVRQPDDWSPRTQQGKGYDLTSGEGRRIWRACQERARAVQIAAQPDHVHVRFGAPATTRPRLGQGAFRVMVTDAYQRACAVTGEHSLPALESAHIRAVSEGGGHEVANGLLLRADLHRLFDRGYLTVDADEQRLLVSRRLRDDFDNGHTYYPMHGQRIALPNVETERPSIESLRWHNEARYLG